MAGRSRCRSGLRVGPSNRLVSPPGKRNMTEHAIRKSQLKELDRNKLLIRNGDHLGLNVQSTSSLIIHIRSKHNKSFLPMDHTFSCNHIDLRRTNFTVDSQIQYKLVESCRRPDMEVYILATLHVGKINLNGGGPCNRSDETGLSCKRLRKGAAVAIMMLCFFSKFRTMSCLFFIIQTDFKDVPNSTEYG